MIFRYTLISDGSSDRALLGILTWLLEMHLPSFDIRPTWAEPGVLPLSGGKSYLARRIAASAKAFPCELLFVHRDAERESHKARWNEVCKALEEALADTESAVPVVPVRMQEAWLLFHEGAIRQAVGNPNGTVDLNLPSLAKVESIVDPKKRLHRALLDASEFHGERRKHFRPEEHAWQVSEFIQDFTPLRRLPAFQAFEANLRQVIADKGWDGRAAPN